MITVRIPKDIREYKEKLVAGLTMRMTLCVIAGGILGGLLFWLNNTTFHWSADTFGFAIMIIAIPIGLVGFFQPEGMPFEKYIVMTFKFGFTKKKLYFLSTNVCKPYQEKKLKPKYAMNRSIERAVIFMESVESDENITLEDADKRLVSIPNKDPNKDPINKKKKKTKLEIKEEKLKQAYDTVKKKQMDMPRYNMNKKEIKAIKDYNYFMENKRKQEVRKKSQPLKRKSNSSKKKNKPKSTLPKSVQEAIPYIREFDDGIFEIEQGVFSKLFFIDDMNYFTAEESKQVDIFAMYAEFLNSFDESITVRTCLHKTKTSSKAYGN